jgi:hypothetical protein
MCGVFQTQHCFLGLVSLSSLSKVLRFYSEEPQPAKLCNDESCLLLSVAIVGIRLGRLVGFGGMQILC